jgi:hypothetical protein
VKKVEGQITELRGQLDQVSRDATGAPMDQLRERVRNEFEVIRQILRRANRLEAESCPRFPLEGRAVWLPRDILDRVGEILSTDQRLARAWAATTWAMPRLFLLPGTGSAVYEEERETIWIPLAGQVQGQCPVTRAIGLHRFHHASNEQRTFGNLAPYKKIKGTAQLAGAFAAAYDTYISRETKGFRKLPAEVHRWFKLNLKQ